MSEEFIKELMDHYVQQGTPFSADMMPRLRAAKGIDYKPPDMFFSPLHFQYV